MSKKESKEVQVKQNQTLPEGVPTNWDMGFTSSKDIMIPKILTMQGLSKLVAARKAQIGDFVESLNSKKIGTIDSKLEFIPLYVKTSWVLFEKGLEPNAQYKYKGQIDTNAENDNLAYEEITPAGMLRRDRTLTVFCLRPEEIKEGVYLPYALSFRRTSFAAGKKLVAGISKLRMFNRPPASMVFGLSGEQKTNEKGTFIVTDVSEVRDSTQAEVKAAFDWYKIIVSSKVNVDDSDIMDDVETKVDESSELF